MIINLYTVAYRDKPFGLVGTELFSDYKTAIKFLKETVEGITSHYTPPPSSIINDHTNAPSFAYWPNGCFATLREH